MRKRHNEKEPIVSTDTCSTLWHAEIDFQKGVAGLRKEEPAWRKACRSGGVFCGKAKLHDRDAHRVDQQSRQSWFLQ
jgi:hypothetical protein